MLKQDKTIDAIGRWAGRLRSQATDFEESPLRNFVGGALSRLVGQTRAIRLLVDTGLTFEADAVVRVVVETAIILLWVWDSDERAARCCADSARLYKDFVAGMKKAGVTVPASLLQHAEEYRATYPGNSLPPLAEMASQAGPPPGWEPLKSDELGPATYLYGACWKRCCASSHPDFHTMLLIDEGKAQLNVYPYRDTLLACLWIILVASTALRAELDADLLREVRSALGAE
jgi:hypothetical protein